MRVENVKQIENELAIVWLKESARSLPYVREETMMLPRRTKAPSPRFTSRNIVAYASLQPDAHSVTPGRFRRRVWYLSGHDPYSDGGGPSEAVNPLSIAAGKVSGAMTDEQWHRNGARERQW